jgi:hypothetical protein
MSTGSASHRTTASGNKRDARCLENEEMFNTSRAAAATTPTVTDAVNVHAPLNASRTTDVDLQSVPTNTSALATASAKIEAFVRTLHYPQQRAVFQDNALRYLHAFAEFYRESKLLLKTKDDPSYCPPSCRITIPLQANQRVRESTAFKALADESARITNEFSLKMAAHLLKVKCLNNADKQKESVELYAKGLANMAEILLAEVNTSSTTKHDLVADLLSNFELDAIGHINMSLDKFVNIYREINKLPARPELVTPVETTHRSQTSTTAAAHQQPDSTRQLQQNTTPAIPTLQINPPNIPNPFAANANTAAPPPSNNTNVATSTTAAPSPGFVSALSLLATAPPGVSHPANPTPKLPTPTQPTPTAVHPSPHVNHNAITAFETAFPYELTPPQNTNHPTPPSQPPAASITHPPPLFTTINPYSKGDNTIHYSREYTTQELEAIQLAEQSHQAAQAASRIAVLDSLRSSGRTMTTNLSTPTLEGANDAPATPLTTTINIVHTTTRGDTDSSTLTGTGDGNTPSSRSTVSFHRNLITGTHHNALKTLHTAVLKCYAEAQAEYIRAFNAKAIEANLTKIAARQRTEECAESTAITILSENTPTPRTVGATIDAKIRRSQQELEKRLQSLEQRLANEKQKSASFERRLQQKQHNQSPHTTTHTAQQSAKDPGAYLVGAAQKKSTTPPTQTALPSTATPRWTPPPSTIQHPKRSAGRGERGNATTQNATGRGANRYNARGHQKNRPTSTRYTGQRHSSA